MNKIEYETEIRIPSEFNTQLRKHNLMLDELMLELEKAQSNIINKYFDSQDWVFEINSKYSVRTLEQYNLVNNNKLNKNERKD